MKKKLTSKELGIGVGKGETIFFYSETGQKYILHARTLKCEINTVGNRDSLYKESITGGCLLTENVFFFFCGVKKTSL